MNNTRHYFYFFVRTTFIAAIVGTILLEGILGVLQLDNHLMMGGGVMALSSKSSSLHQQSQRQTKFPNSIPVASDDVDTFRRQTGQINPAMAAIGVPAKSMCRHGFPQVFVLDPYPPGERRINSGILKLTCPHLVRAVDDLEDQGMIQNLNEQIGDTSSIKLNEGEEKDPILSIMLGSHKRHSNARKRMLTQDDITSIQSKLGEKGVHAFLESGVAGSSITSKDAKCLHAWLGDSLFYINQEDGKEERNDNWESHAIGEWIVDKLQQQNIDLTGTSTCHQFCDSTLCNSMASPPKPRNKQRLRTSKEIQRRKRRRTETQEEAE